MPNQRISELPESGPLYFDDVPFNSIYTQSPEAGSSSDWFLMTARPKVSNEKISFPNFQRSVLNDAVYLKGDQTISGHKIFLDDCHITKRANITSIQDPDPDGAFSGASVIGTTGSFEIFITQTGETLTNNTAMLDEAYLEGNLTIQNTTTFSDTLTLNNLNTNNFTSSSGSFNIDSISATGNSRLNSNVNVSGDLTASGSLSAAGDLAVHENVFSNHNQHLQFTPDHIQITNNTDNFIDITTGNIKYKQIINVNESNVVNLSDGTPSGTFHVDGTGYVQNINALSDTTYRQFFGGDDESMIFANRLSSGSRDFTIDLPKTFLDIPIINPNLQHVSGGYIIPYIISNVSETDYSIRFGEDILDDDFVLHTTAMAPSTGRFSTNKKGIQRFRTTLPSGTISQQISFPEAHNLKPTVSISIQAQNEIIPYTISGVNTNNYTIFLSAESTEDYIIHTISTEYDNQRIS